MRKAFKALAIGLALVLGGALGALMWLRGAAGADFVFERLRGALASAGFELSASCFEGPLPGRLKVRDLRLADSQGLLASVEALDLELRLASLWQGELQVELLRLERPELWRLPAPSPSQPEPEPEDGDEPFSLPVALRLDDLTINRGRLGAGALRSLDLLWPELNLQLSGQAYLADTWRASLKALATESQDSGAELELRLSLAARPEDLGAAELELWLAGRADEIAALEPFAALPPGLSGPLTLSLTAQGALDDLKAELQAASEGLQTPNGPFSQPRLKLQAAGQALPRPLEGGGSGPRLSGSLSLAASDSPAGPLELSSSWAFDLTPAERWARLGELRASLAGLDLSGDLEAGLRPAAQPFLKGFLQADLKSWAGLAALSGLELAGEPLTLALELQANNSGQNADLQISAPGLRLQSEAETLLALQRLKLDFQGRDLFGQPDLSLDFKAAAGQAPALSWAGADIRVQGQGGQGDLAVDLKGLSLKGQGGGASDGLSLSGSYDVKGPSLSLASLEARLAGAALKLSQPVRLEGGPDISLSPLELAFSPGGSLKAEVDMRPQSLKIEADISELPLSLVQMLSGLDAIPDGRLKSLKLSLAQAAEGAAGELSLDLALADRAKLGSLKPELQVQAQLSGGSRPRLDFSGALSAAETWPGGGRFSGWLDLKAGASGLPSWDPQAPVSAAVELQGPLGPLWFLARQPDSSLEGLVRLNASVSGTLAQPQPQGLLYLAGGRYEDRILGLTISDLNLEARSTPDLPLRALLSAGDGRGGALAIEAEIRDLARMNLEAQGRLSLFSPLHRDDSIVFISGDLAASGPLKELKLSSDLTLEKGELNLSLIQAASSVSTLELASSEQAKPGESSAGGPHLDLSLRLPHQFFIRGYGLESEWRGGLKVSGPVSRPSLSGQLYPVRGYFSLFSKEFNFGEGGISFNGGTDPILDLRLVNQGPNLEAIILVSGSGRRPRLSLSSRPPRPEEEIMSQILFGKSSSSISRFEAIQLANGLMELASFGSSGGLSLLGGVRQGLGLDVLRLGGSSSDRQRQVSDLSGSLGREAALGSRSGGDDSGGAPAVEAGKYISDNVYVGVEHSGSGGPAVRLEVELKPSLSLEASTSSESSQVGLGWKKDY